MRKFKVLLTIMVIVLLMASFAGCGSDDSDTAVDDTKETEAAFDPADSIDRIEQFGEVEDGITYWYVYLKEDVEWTGYDVGEEMEIWQYAVAKCLVKSTESDDHSVSVMLWESDDKLALSWGSPHTSEYYVYTDGKKTATYEMTEAEWDAIKKYEEQIEQ